EFTNVDGKSTNISTLFRFDPNKRRVFGSLSGPMNNGARYQIAVDARDENWDWKGNRFRLPRQEGAAGVTKIATDPFTGSSNVRASRRSSGFYLKPGGSAQYDLWVAAEKRLTVATAIRGEVGRALSHPQRFARVEPGVYVHWLPKTRDTDYETRV